MTRLWQIPNRYFPVMISLSPLLGMLKKTFPAAIPAPIVLWVFKLFRAKYALVDRLFRSVRFSHLCLTRCSPSWAAASATPDLDANQQPTCGLTSDTEIYASFLQT
jgi:hypothetical protein